MIEIEYDQGKPFREAWTVKSNSKDITHVVKGISIFTDIHEEYPVVDIELILMKLTTVGGDVRWEGLEDIPTQALEQELNSRERQ